MNDNNVSICTKILSEVCSEWLSMERLIVKRSTYAKYFNTVHKHIEPVLGPIPLASINSTQINTFIYDKLTNGRLDNSGPLSSKTVRDIYTILKSIIKYGENEYHLGGIALNTVLPKKRVAECKILTPAEQYVLETYLWEDPHHPRKAGLLLCMYTGLRLGEICALRWQDIEWNTCFLTVKHTLQRIPVTDNKNSEKTCLLLDSPKSSASVRTIPLSPPIVTLLKKLKAGAAPDTYVLSNRSDCIEPRNYQYFFHKTLEILKLRKVNFHILRHTFASRCVEAGFDVKTLSEILGHSNTEITLSYYIHTSMDNKRKQMELLKPVRQRA